MSWPRSNAGRTAIAGAMLVGAAGAGAQAARARAVRRRISWAPGGGVGHHGSLYARTLGDGVATMVLLHGLGGSNAYWGAAYDVLAGTGRLVVPDLLGFGDSPRPHSGYTTDDHVRALTTVLDELDVTRPVVVGAHSLGCIVAFALADQRPDLVAGIVAFCPPLYPDEVAARERIARLGWLERQLATDGPWAQIACRWVCGHGWAAATLVAALRPGLPVPIRRGGLQHGWESYSQTFGNVLAAAEGGGWLAHVDVPVVLVAGTDDRVVDLGYLRRLADDLPHVSLTVRQGVDHDLPLTDPAGTVAVLQRATRIGQSI